MSIPNASKLTEVGRYFIHLANQEGRGITNKKLQKLVYYAQAWSLVLRGDKLFNEDIEAWVHGPAVRPLYGQYKQFGFASIQETVDLGSLKLLSSEEKDLLGEIWKVYGKFDAGYLEMLTHSERPWQIARAGLESHESSSNIISTESMKEFYTQKLAEAHNAK